MKIYLSGPMKGYPQSNYPLFHEVTQQLRIDGHIVYNPAEFKHEEKEFPIRKAFMDYCKFIIEEADTLIMLPGFKNSRGASAELALAKVFELRIIEWVDYKNET